MKLIDTFNEEKVLHSESVDFRLRRAVRVIVFDLENKIALVNSQKRNYYELPGGGVEDKETYQEAAYRECQEEIGCEIKIKSELGYILEYRKLQNFKKETYGYLAELNGEKGDLKLSGDELDLQIVIKWVSVAEAIKLISSSSKPQEYIAKLCVKRDLRFIEEMIKKRLALPC